MHVVKYFKNMFLISEHQGMITAKNMTIRQNPVAWRVWDSFWTRKR